MVEMKVGQQELFQLGSTAVLYLTLVFLAKLPFIATIVGTIN